MTESIAQSIVSQAAMPMALVRGDGTIQLTSPPWDRLFAATATTLAALIAEQDGEAVALALGTPRSCEGRAFDVRLRADRAKSVQLQMTPTEGDAILVVAADVTAVRAELAELQDRVAFMEWQALSLSTFTKVMTSARLVLFSMDSAGVTTMSDGKGLELLGQKPGERVGRNELYATVGTQKHEHLRRALAGETFRVLEEPISGVFFDTWYMPQRDENDKLAGVLGLSVDATERVVSEQQLAEKTELVAKQTATIRDLAAPIIKSGRRWSACRSSDRWTRGAPAT